MKPYDVIIAGGGAAGLSLAYHLTWYEVPCAIAQS